MTDDTAGAPVVPDAAAPIPAPVAAPVAPPAPAAPPAQITMTSPYAPAPAPVRRRGLGLLSTVLVAAVVAGDAKRLTKVKGIGQKTADQILLDLRGKAAALTGGSANAPAARGPAQLEDAVTALISIGYSEKDARKQVERAAKSVDPANLELLVRTALQG